MRVRAQIGMVLNLDKCIQLLCARLLRWRQNTWTSRDGVEYTLVQQRALIVFPFLETPPRPVVEAEVVEAEALWCTHRPRSPHAPLASRAVPIMSESSEVIPKACQVQRVAPLAAVSVSVAEATLLFTVPC